MTSTPPGQQEKKPSRGRRAAGAAALIAALGVTGWAVVAGPSAPAPEPTSRPVQAGGSPSASPDTPERGLQESGSTDSADPESSPASPPAAPAAPPEPGAPATEPAPPATEAATPESPAPADRGAPAFAPPAPAGKIIDQPPPVAPAKSFEDPAPVAEGVATRVTAMKAVDGEARGVGEVGGPAVQFTLEVTNTTKEPISLAEAVVNVEAGADRFPAELLSGPGTAPLPAEVGPGKSVSGVFVFQIPPEQRESVRLLFHYQAVLPVAAFEGAAPMQGDAS